MKVKTNTEKKQRNVFTGKICGNSPSLYLNIKVKKDGKIVHEEKGNSFVRNFPALLGYMFNLGVPIDTSIERNTLNNFGLSDINCCTLGRTSRSDVSVINWNQDTNTVRFSMNSSTAMHQQMVRNSEYIGIQDGPNRGIYKIEGFVEVTNWAQWDLILDKPVPDTNAPMQFNRSVLFFYYTNPVKGRSENNLRITRIALGAGDTPVTLQDFNVEDEYYDDELEIPGIPTVSAPVVVGNESKIACTQTFTNVTGETKVVREIGLFLNQSTATVHGTGAQLHHRLIKEGGITSQSVPIVNVMVSRDVITPLTVAHGENFTIIYEVVCSADTINDTVMTENFSDLLFRQMADSSRSIRDYFNVTRTHGKNVDQFKLYSNTAGTYQTVEFHHGVFNPNQLDLSHHGIVLGSEESEVDIDDVFLRNEFANAVKIPNGSHAGALIYQPTFYSGFEITGTEALLVFSRFIENKSGAPITVKQLGFCIAHTGSTTIPVLISRINLGTPEKQFTIADGEFWKIEYKIGVSIGS